MNNDDDNAKNPAWELPMTMPGVKPKAYDRSIDSGHGSAQDPKRRKVSPYRRTAAGE